MLLTDRDVACALTYTVIHMIFALLLGKGFLFALIGGGVGFLLAWLYFWLLIRTQESFVFWLVAIGGILICLV